MRYELFTAEPGSTPSMCRSGSARASAADRRARCARVPRRG
jgi:hypothetical protein